MRENHAKCVTLDRPGSSQNVLPTTFKLFVRPHHDHSDIIYDRT